MRRENKREGRSSPPKRGGLRPQAGPGSITADGDLSLSLELKLSFVALIAFVLGIESFTKSINTEIQAGLGTQSPALQRAPAASLGSSPTTFDCAWVLLQAHCPAEP